MHLFALLVGGVMLTATPAGAHAGAPSSVPVVAPADSATHHFDAAREAYRQGRYEEAVEHYQRILDAGSTSAALYHNLGNAYVRLDRVGPAIWAYEKGRRLRPSDPRLQHNLEYIRRQEGLPLGGLPPRGLSALVSGWSPLVLFGMGWLLLGAGLLAGAFWAEPDRWVAWRWPGAWGPVGIGLLLVIGALGASYLHAQDHRAVAVAEEVPVRSTPADTTQVDTTVIEGTMVEIRTRRGGWAEVRLGDGRQGWVPGQAIREV